MCVKLNNETKLRVQNQSLAHTLKLITPIALWTEKFIKPKTDLSFCPVSAL